MWESSCIWDITGIPGWRKALPITSSSPWPLLLASDQRLPPTQSWHKSSSSCWPQSWQKPSQLLLLPLFDVATTWLSWIKDSSSQVSSAGRNCHLQKRKQKTRLLHEMNRQSGTAELCQRDSHRLGICPEIPVGLIHWCCSLVGAHGQGRRIGNIPLNSLNFLVMLRLLCFASFQQPSISAGWMY